MVMTIGFAAGVLLLAVLVGMVSVLYARPAGAQTAPGVPGMRQVTVVGRGEVKGRPDTATVQIGVETQGATAQEALAQNTTQAQALIARLTELGVAEADMQTVGFNIFPVYGEDGRQITGYRVSNNVMVTIRNLDRAGALLDGVVQAGANSIYGISFSVADQKALLDQARTQAIADAQARAALLAQAAGASVGDVLVITENIGAQPAPVMARAEVMAADVPIQPGEQQIAIDVQVTFALR
jgi:hypothetical protein